MRPGFFLLPLLLLAGFYTQAQTRLIKTPELVSLVNKSSSDTLHVFNFWATWCKPCVKEIPYFVAADKKYAGKKIKFHFVSFDMRKNKAATDSFVVKKNMPGLQYFADETDFDPLITAIDRTWDGAIPFTILVRGDMRLTKVGDFDSQEELFTTIEQFLKN